MNWEMIFKLSVMNGGEYTGDQLPPQNWKFPKDTWLQKRLRDLRSGKEDGDGVSNKQYPPHAQ